MKLVIIHGSKRGREFKIEEGNNLIGRWDPDAGSFPEIDLEQDDVEAKISRKHAVLELKGGAVTLEDIGSKNGTFISGGDRLEVGRKYDLTPGMEIIVGKTVLRLEQE